MSRLEGEAKPIIESLLDGTTSRIDHEAQSILARWAVKTAMVLEAFHPKRACFYSAEKREQVRVAQSIPHRTEVWIAQCVNQPDLYSAGKDMDSGGPQAARAYAVTMAFGSLAFQVLTIKPPAIIPAHMTVTYEVSPGPWPEILLLVWPASEDALAWPLRQGLNSECGLDALTERFNPAES